MHGTATRLPNGKQAQTSVESLFANPYNSVLTGATAALRFLTASSSGNYLVVVISIESNHGADQRHSYLDYGPDSLRRQTWGSRIQIEPCLYTDSSDTRHVHCESLPVDFAKIVFLTAHQDSFAYGLFVPALPAILDDQTSIPAPDWQFWISTMVTVFGVGDLLGALACGWLSDNYRTRKAPLLVGLCFQLAAMMILGCSKHARTLVLSRALSGLSCGVVNTAGLALIIDTVSKSSLGRWVGFALSAGNVGWAVAPSIGGVLYSKTGIWGLVGLALGMIGVDLVLRLMILERPGNPLLTTSSVQQPDPEALPSKGMGVGITEVTERTTETPQRRARQLPPMLRLLKSPRILAACYGMFVAFLILLSFESLLPVVAERRFDLSTPATGLVLLTLGLPTAFGYLQGLLSDRIGTGLVALLGSVLTPVPLICLRFANHPSSAQIALLCVLLFSVGK